MRAAIIVGWYTWKEVIKSKIYLILFYLGLFIAGLSYTAASFSYGEPQKVALDIGLGVMSILNLFVSIFLGASLVTRELEERTIYILLARDVPRYSVLLGKLIGLIAVLFMNCVILSAFTYFAFWLLGGKFDQFFIWVSLFTLMESIWMVLIVVLFSMITNLVLTVSFSLITFTIGNSLSKISDSVFVKSDLLLTGILKGAKFIFPDFNVINLKPYILYESAPGVGDLFMRFSYWILFSVLLVLGSIKIFNKKELN